MWQRSSTTYPDPYELVLGLLRAAVSASVDPAVTGAVIARKTPRTRPQRLVQVRRDGGIADGLVDRPTITYRVWAENDRAAHQLAKFVRETLLSAPYVFSGVQIVNATDVAGPLDVTDPDDPDTTTFFGRVELWLR